MRTRLTVSLAVLALSGCVCFPAAEYKCDDDDCLGGWVCEPTRQVCVEALGGDAGTGEDGGGGGTDGGPSPDCSATPDDPLYQIPVVSTVDPYAVCGGQLTEFLVAGTGIRRTSAGEEPGLRVGDEGLGGWGLGPGEGACSDLGGGVEDCVLMRSQAGPGVIPEPGAAGVDPLEVSIVNPGAGRCTSAPAMIATLAPPTLTGAPTEVCGGSAVVTVDVTGFYFPVDGQSSYLQASEGGSSFFIATVPETASCTPIGAIGEACTRVTLTFSPSELVLNSTAAVVGFDLRSPALGCDPPGTDFEIWMDRQPPSPASDPLSACPGDLDVALAGTNFVDGNTEVLIDGTPVPTRVINPGSLAFDVPGSLTAGTYAVTTRSSGGPGSCVSSTEATLTVGAAPPLVVDPPRLPPIAGLPVRFFSHPQATVTSANLTLPAVSPTPVNGTSGTGVFVGTLPENPSTGTYDASITTAASTCPGTQPGGLRVVSDTPLPDPLNIYPPTVSQLAGVHGTPVRITGSFSIDPIPHVWVIEVTSGAAERLVSVAWLAADELEVVVPSSLAAGTYNVVLLTPNDDWYSQPGALTVSAAPPPRVDSVDPPVAPPPTVGDTATVRGSGFGADSAMITPTLNCLSGSYPIGVESAGFSSTQFELALGAAPLTPGDGDVCLLLVTMDDGQVAVFSGMAFRDPASSALPVTAKQPLNTPRSAPAAALVRYDATRRYLYAFGGDVDTFGNPTDSVEVAAIGPFGEMDPWQLRPTGVSLPSQLTEAGAAVVGRYIYLSGGRVSASGAPTAPLQWAMVLDPEHRPVIGDYTLDPTRSGPGPGTWSYRVMADLDRDADSANGLWPGRSVASEPVVVELGADAAVVFSWISPAVPAATGHVYRSPLPVTDSSTGPAWHERRLTGAPTGPSVEDTGLLNTPTSPQPPRPGALSTWQQQDLLVPVRGAAVAAVPFPSPSTEYYLFTAGGMTDGPTNSTARTTTTQYARLSLDGAAPWVRTVQALDYGPGLLPNDGDALFGGVAVHPGMGGPAGTTFFARLPGPGSSSPDVFEVGDGTVTDYDCTTCATLSGVAQYAAVAAVGRVWLLGGIGISPGRGVRSGEVFTQDIGNWFGESDQLPTWQYRPGGAYDELFFFVVGGRLTNAFGGEPTDAVSGGHF